MFIFNVHYVRPLGKCIFDIFEFYIIIIAEKKKTKKIAFNIVLSLLRQLAWRHCKHRFSLYLITSVLKVQKKRILDIRPRTHFFGAFYSIKVLYYHQHCRAFCIGPAVVKYINTFGPSFWSGANKLSFRSHCTNGDFAC